MVTGPDREIVVELSDEAYVRVVDRTNLYNYESGAQYEYHGPKTKVRNASIKVPSLGRWFIIVETENENIVSVKWSLTEK